MADYLHHFGATPFELWRRGVHLLDVARLVAHIPTHDSAMFREDEPDHEWAPLSTQLAAAVANEVRDLHWRVLDLVTKQRVPRPPRIGPPGAEREDGDVEVERIQVKGFDSFEEVDAWYARRFPDRPMT